MERAEVSMRTLTDIADMVSDWQVALALGQWTFRLTQKRSYDDRVFRVEHVRHYREVQVKVYPEALTMPATRCWRFVCHELLHPFFWPVEEVLATDIGEGAVYERWHDAEETAIDALSIQLVELFPMPAKYAEAPAK